MYVIYYVCNNSVNNIKFDIQQLICLIQCYILYIILDVHPLHTMGRLKF